ETGKANRRGEKSELAGARRAVLADDAAGEDRDQRRERVDGTHLVPDDVRRQAHRIGNNRRDRSKRENSGTREGLDRNSRRNCKRQAAFCRFGHWIASMMCARSEARGLRLIVDRSTRRSSSRQAVLPAAG